jgi:hypothetical protein
MSSSLPPFDNKNFDAWVENPATGKGRRIQNVEWMMLDEGGAKIVKISPVPGKGAPLIEDVEYSIDSGFEIVTHWCRIEGPHRSSEYACSSHGVYHPRRNTGQKLTASSVKSTKPITVEELLTERMMHLISYDPRYGGGGIGVFIAGHIECLTQMADAMSDSGDYAMHIYNMLYGTPYFPWGEGDTLQEAITVAMARVNSIPRDHWLGYAYIEVFNAPRAYSAVRDSYRDWNPLPSLEELMKPAT